MSGLLREYWDWFLFDTLLWTGVLIALVMVLRRPVARHFGSAAAYTLWFLPLARLLVPPFVLPAWMRPASELAPVAPLSEPLPAVSATPVTSMIDAVPPAMPDPVDFVTPLVALWLLGAAIMLTRRFWLYFALRRELLEQARPVGDVGTIRLIETPAISGPMAFGVIDRVVALPEGFMAGRDRISRDLAIAHELAHHRGGDLLVNMVVQPLFAIHWFNPLGWLGWNALRRDQEAACDARVVALRSHAERAAYAGIIAEFARIPGGAPRPALAAPMACPVLGDKSIIHRLRSLTMSDISPRRRLVGRAAMFAAFLAVPLTASIAYSQPEPPAPPEAPTPPQAPAAPEAPTTPDMTDIDLDDDAWAAEGSDEHGRHVIVRREVDDDGKVTETRRVYRISSKDMTAEERADFERDMADHERDMAELDREMAELHKNMSENGQMRREIRIAVRDAQASASAARAHAMANATEVVMSCKNPKQPVTSETTPDGRTRMFVCETAGDAIARDALVSARKAIAADKHMPAEARAEALAELDREIAAHD